MKTFKIWLDKDFNVLQNDPAGLKAINSNVDQFEVQSQSQLGHEMVFASELFVSDVTYPMTFDRQETIDNVINYFYKLDLKEATLPPQDNDYSMTIQVNATDGSIDPITLSTIQIPYKVIKQSSGAIVYIPIDVVSGINNRLTNIEINKWDKPKGTNNLQTEISNATLVNLTFEDGSEATTTFGTFKQLVQAGGITGTYASISVLRATYPPGEYDPNNPDRNYSTFVPYVQDWEGEGTNDKVAGWDPLTPDWFNTETAPQVTREEFESLKSVVDADTIRINNLEISQASQDTQIAENKAKSDANELQVAINTTKNTEQDASILANENAIAQNTQDIDDIKNNDSTGLGSKVDKTSIDTTTLSDDTTRVPSSAVMTNELSNKIEAIDVNGTSGILKLANASGQLNPSDPSEWVFDDSSSGGGTKIYNLAQANVDYTIIQNAPPIVLNYATTEATTDPAVLSWDNASGVATLGSSNTLYEIALRGQINKGGQQDATFTAMLVDADTGQMVPNQQKTESIEADNDSKIVNMVFHVSSASHSKVRVEVSATGNDLSISAGTTNEIEAYTFGQSSSSMTKVIYDQNDNGRVDNADFGSYQLTTNYADTDNTNDALLRTDSLFGNLTLVEDRNGLPISSTQEGFNKWRDDMGDVNSLVAIENSNDIVEAILENWNRIQTLEKDVDTLEARITRPDIGIAQLNDSLFIRNEEASTNEQNILFTDKNGSHKLVVKSRESYDPAFARVRSTTETFMFMGESSFDIEFDTQLGDNPTYMLEGTNAIKVIDPVASEKLQLVGVIDTLTNVVANRFYIKLSLTRGADTFTLSETAINEIGDINTQNPDVPLLADDIIRATIIDVLPNANDTSTIVFKEGIAMLMQNGNHRGVITTKVENITFAELNTIITTTDRLSFDTPYKTEIISTNEMASVKNLNWENDNTTRYTEIQMINGVAGVPFTLPNSIVFEGEFQVRDTFTDNALKPVSGYIIWDTTNQTWSFEFKGNEKPPILDLKSLGTTYTQDDVYQELNKWYLNEPSKNGIKGTLLTLQGTYEFEVKTELNNKWFTSGITISNSAISGALSTIQYQDFELGNTTQVMPINGNLKGADPQVDTDFATKGYVDYETITLSYYQWTELDMATLFISGLAVYMYGIAGTGGVWKGKIVSTLYDSQIFMVQADNIVRHEPSLGSIVYKIRKSDIPTLNALIIEKRKQLQLLEENKKVD